jgi:hypothetical protein
VNLLRGQCKVKLDKPGELPKVYPIKDLKVLKKK